MSSLARKVLDLADQQGLLEPKVIEELRQKLQETRYVVSPASIAKVLVDHGHLTPFQARKLVSQALGPGDGELPPAPAAAPPKKPAVPEEELTFLDEGDRQEAAAGAAGQDDEIVQLELVDLEPIEAPPTRPATKPAPKQPAVKLTELAPQPRKERPPPAATAPAVGDDDLVGLEPLPSSPAPAARKWKGQAPSDELEPLDELTPLDEGLTPLEPAAASPRSAAAATMTPPAAAAAPAKKSKAKQSRWDSPLMLVGGGLLGVLLIAVATLMYALTRGNAAKELDDAHQEYNAGNYAAAISGYERFLERYASNPSAGVARIRLGMAKLQQMSDSGKNPGQGLQTAKEVLPQIEKEERFGDARPELASVLIAIAGGFADQAGQAKTTERKEELVKLVNESLQLVNNPSYVPASLRKEREGPIADVVDKLAVAQRSIDQDKELVAAIAKIKAAAEQSDAREAYQVRDDLVRKYPALEVNKSLLDAVVGVGESERKLVKVSEGGPAAVTDDLPAASTKVVLSVREGPASAAAGKPVFVLAEGSAYGLDSSSGRVLWRRFVGYESTIWPVALPAGNSSDALLVDRRAGELLRLTGASGQLAWRVAAGEVLASPVLHGERIYATTKKGQVLALEAATGKVLHTAQLPQAASVAAALGGQTPRLLQLGEHSTLFVLSPETLACTETHYLGHKAGAIFVPPAAVLEQVLVVESPADDYSLVHVLSPDAKTKQLAEIGRPLRLKGRVLTPPAVKGRRAAFVTDLGQVAVYEIDASNPQQPVRLLAGQDASERSPHLPQLTFDGNRLWTASRRCAMFEVQGSLQQLNRKWAAYQDDMFLGPLSVQGDSLVHVRRRPGGAAVLVEGCDADDGKQLWTTHLASPVVALAVSESRKTVDLLTGEGRLFSLGSPQLQQAVVDTPTFSPPVGSGPAILPHASLAGDQLLWTDAAPGGRVFGYNVASGGQPTSATLPAGAQAAAPAQLLGSRWLVPLSNGSVVLLDAGGSAAAVQPFLPPLEPSNLPLWTAPATNAAGDSFLISDGRGKVFAVALRNQPQPHLAQVAAASTDGPVVTPLVLAGSTYFGVARGDAGDSLLGFDGQGQSAFEPIALSGRCQAGPFAAGGLVLLTTQAEGLLCYEAGGKLRWQQPLKHGPIAGGPIVCDGGDLLVVHQQGMVTRVDPASGAELASHDVAQPLGGAARILGASVFLAGSDGVLHRIALPQRP